MRRALGIPFLLLAVALTSCAAGGRGGYAPRGEEDPPAARTGIASFISPALAGRRTASGVPFDPELRVCAHRTLPFGTRLRVINLANERTVVVTVVDRGPFRRGRIVDVSPDAARALGFHREGLARVRIEVVERGDEAAATGR